jgi:D-arabinose 1-dehydrogenase-like Zn-dependent alcohol dehydrogenase
VQAAKSTMDGIIDTVSASHPILPLIDLLKTNGKLILLGAPEKPLELPVFPLLIGKFYKLNKQTLFAIYYIYIYPYYSFMII